MTGRSLAAAVALLALPVAAAAAPQRPATVGDNRVDDRGASSFAVAAGTGALAPFTGGNTLLDAAGAERWTLAGAGAPHPGGGAVVLTGDGPYRVTAAGALAPIADRPAAPRDGGGVLVEADGRVAVTDGATVTMLSAAGTVLWTASGGGELVRGPAHLYAGARVLDPSTGAAVGTLPEGRVRVAPDGTLRILGGGTLTATGATGGVLWSHAVTPGSTARHAVGTDGTTYVPAWSATPGQGTVVAVDAAGAERWRAAVVRRPSGAALDGAGNVWVGLVDGRVAGITPAGTWAWALQASRDRVNPPEVAAMSDGTVLVTGGGVRVRVRGRAPAAGRPAVRMTTPAPFRMAPRRIACAPEAPSWCVTRRDDRDLRLRVPVDGTATLTITDPRGRRIPQGPLRLLRGVNRVALFTYGTSRTCDLFRRCTPTAGVYRVRARVAVGGGRSRVLTGSFGIR